MTRIGAIKAARAVCLPVATIMGALAVASAMNRHWGLCALDAAACLADVGAYVLNGLTLRRLRMIEGYEKAEGRRANSNSGEAA